MNQPIVAAGIAHCRLGGADEPLSHDPGGGNLVTFGSDGVMQTARRATAKAAGITLAGAEHGKRLSAEKRGQIIAALKANPNAAEVAKQIGGVTHVGVRKIAKVAGIELTRSKAARDHRLNKVSG